MRRADRIEVRTAGRRRRLLTAIVTLCLVPLAMPSAATAAGEVLFGAYPGTVGGRLSALHDVEADLGRPLDVVRVFEEWDSPFPEAFHLEVMGGDSIMLLSVRARTMAGSFVPWQDIADSAPGSALHDRIAEWVEDIVGLGVPIWFTFNHEPEIVENIPNGTDDGFIAAWRRFYDEFQARGAANVEFVWIMTDYSFELPAADRRHAAHWYPGDAYVDHIAADAYNWSDCRAGVFNPWRPLEDIITPLRTFGAAHPDKGLMLAEWASTENGDGGAAKAEWVAEAASLLAQPGWEQFIAVSYFNHVDGKYPNCRWPMDSTPLALEALADMGADPFFGGSGGEPPLPDDGVFAGLVDATGATAPRWTATSYEPAASGVHELVLDWAGGGMLRFDLREAATSRWVGADVSEAKPKSMTVSLDAGVGYKLAVWAMTGTGRFSVLAVPAGDPPPRVEIVFPPPDAVVHGIVTVVATADDESDAVEVRFSANGGFIGVDTDPDQGWTALWDTTQSADGSAELVAQVMDSAGRMDTDSVNVTIDNTPPEIVLVAPAQGAIVAGTVPIVVTATDDVGVTSVSFSAAGEAIAVDSEGIDGWSTLWSTPAFANGPTLIEAVAADMAGWTSTVSASVVVDNPVPGGDVIFAERVDRDRVVAPRWISTIYAPEHDGRHDFVLDWTGEAMLRFDIREAGSGLWVGADVSEAQPKTMSVVLAAGIEYRLAVWSMSGSADFTVTASVR